MDKERIVYFNGSSARPSTVRVLLFNESINLYDAEEDHFIGSFALKGSFTTQAGDNYFVYLDSTGTIYLQLKRDHPIFDSLWKEVASANDNWLRKLMKQKIIVLLTIMLTLVVGIYILLVTLVPVLGARMISKDVEIALGNSLNQVMMQEEKMAGAEVDSSGTAKLQEFADKLRLSEDYPIHLTLVKSKIVNAYALPGGQIVVYTGLLDKISSPEPLVALLAHESSHVNQRHTLRSLLKSAANGILISIVFGDATGVTGGLASNAETLRGLQYSRSIETEADNYGMEIMIKNGVDVSGMRQLMMVLKEEGDIPQSISFLSSHPLTAQRIQRTEMFIQKHPQNKISRSDLEKSFRQLKK